MNQDQRDQIALEKWIQLNDLQEAFPYTEEGLLDFAQLVLTTMIPGAPQLNDIQEDILRYMYNGPSYRMVQAQRGQAKTTMAAIFAAFLLIHFPHFRILVFSQNSKRAKEIAGWVIKIFYRLSILEFMLPDHREGDKDSADAFDIHWSLKGSDKSPSVSCYSIESGAQGSRADFILADDIESLQNSRTEARREWLEEQSKEFESINQYGDILYLGTPQSSRSMYNTLPARGYDIRIWTGRYPNQSEMPEYGDFLAPLLRERMEKNPELMTGHGIGGDQGAPTCPEMFNEDVLCKKEISQGKAKFKLQFMLSTSLADQNKFPLKLENLVVAAFTDELLPETPVWSKDARQRLQNHDTPIFGRKESDRLYRALPYEYKLMPPIRKIMCIDGAGGGKNGDETGYAIIYLLGNRVYLRAWGGVKGGYDDVEMDTLVRLAKDHGVKEVFVEDNYGNGAHLAVLKPAFIRAQWPVTLEPYHVKGQKEVRIIDTLEPIISSHRLIVHEEVIQADYASVQKYAEGRRLQFSGFHQLCNITYDKDCLGHDDRVDALAGAVAQVIDQISHDEEELKEQRRQKEIRDWINKWHEPNAGDPAKRTSRRPNTGTNRFTSRKKVGKRW